MDFKKLLSVADYNKATSEHEASNNRFYSSTLPPPKKAAKAGVQSDGIKKFLEKKKAEEQARINEARKQKEQLLTLRSQNTKNNKKAKIMASRTKDNDFSKIRLTEDEIESKKKIEQELTKKHLATKVERMKVRIEMEEKEKLLPKKRKRKSKNGMKIEEQERMMQEIEERKKLEASSSSKRKPPKPPPSNLSFSELLKVAEKKQFEPIELKARPKEDDRPMSKKERKLAIEEQERLQRKQERLARGEDCNSKSRNSEHNKKHQKTLPSSKSEPSKFKIPKSSSGEMKVQTKTADENRSHKTASSSNSHPDFSKKRKDVSHSSSKPHNSHQQVVPKKSKVVPMPQPEPTMTFDTDAIAAAIEKRLREKLEREVEAKLAARFGLILGGEPLIPPPEKPQAPEKPPQSKVPAVNGKPPMKVECRTIVHKRPLEKGVKRDPAMVKTSNPKLVEKKPFHKNPYLDPPRRLLESQRPQKPPSKRRIESDDEDDDDMSDFIDDGPSQNDEDYSKYIKEIFGYDRNRYNDCDDDDIVETSFAEQQKEEVRSARLGYLEDLEEEKLQEKEKKMKKKKSKK